MNHQELTEIVASGHNLAKAEARRVIDTVLKAITDAAARGEETSLAGFGRFKISALAERPGRNPATGEPITIPPSRRIAFLAAKALKDAIKA